jgi:hypothetical protein
VDCSGAETSRLKEFEIPSYGGSECRLSAADDHRVEKQVTFVDEIGFERKSCQLGAANEDVVLRFALELPSRLGIELPLDTRDACGAPVSVREKTICSAFCQTRAKSRCSGG